MNKNSFKKIFLILTLVILVLLGPTSINGHKKTQAIGGGVWVDTSFDFHSIMDNQKNFVWDRLATLFAKQLLHQMTVSVVNWINNGFEGSPAFLTDPEGFFLDAADQTTGQFIREGGPLSKLCGPIGIDIRLSLALDQTVTASKRYECTLGKIVNNVSGTVEGFVGGDFSQGGWPAFVSLSVEPQNNIYGASLQARSDLLSAIGEKKNSINLDLNRGSGFLSYKDCKSDGSEEAYYAQQSAIGLDPDSEEAYYAQQDIKSHQVCTVQTPGSVISGLLGKQLQGPATELELANNINAVVNALVSQLVTQTLSGGLHNLSRGSSGGSPSYTSQIIRDLNSTQNTEVQGASSQLSTVFDPAIASLTQYKSIYDQAITLVTNTRSKYQNAKSCLASKTTIIGYAYQYQQNRINQALNTQIDPLLASLVAKQSDAATKILQIQASKSQVSATTATVQSQLPSYQTNVQQAIDVNSQASSNLTSAQKELDDAKKLMQKLDNELASYQISCSNQ